MLNKVILMGRLTADPELRQTPSGVSTCRFTVAVDREFVGQGQERQADFITVTAWRQSAEFVSRYFSKGRMICVEGSIRTGSYVDKRYSDVTHYTTEVYADRVYFTGEKATGNQQGGNYAPQQYSPAGIRILFQAFKHIDLRKIITLSVPSRLFPTHGAGYPIPPAPLCAFANSPACRLP